jgi:predicted aconitase with swiveling domain
MTLTLNKLFVGKIIKKKTSVSKRSTGIILIMLSFVFGARGSVVGSGIMLQAGR